MPNKKESGLLTFLSLVFFLSGLSSLIYQVVWQRLLTLYYGVGPVSTTLIVGVYMLGLGIGALAGGKIAEQGKNTLKLYFIIELLIAFFGLFSLTFISWLGSKTAGSPYPLTAVLLFAFLSVPTILMGMTLPILTKIFNNITHKFLESVGFLYFINTLGAAAGCLVASYGLITFYGFDVAVYCAAGINILLAVAIYTLLCGQANPQEQTEQYDTPLAEKGHSFGYWIYFLALVTGFTAIAYEIVWFRLIGVLCKASAYSFPSVLFVYLSGIAAGSFWIKQRLLKHPDTDKKNLLFSLQFLTGLTAAFLILGYYYLTKYTAFYYLTLTSFSVPLHPPLAPLILQYISTLDNVFLASFYLTDIFLWPLFFMFIPTFFMGASFPLIAFLGLSANDNREAQTIGKIYFFNVIGSVAGAFLTGFVLLPTLGSERTLLLCSLIGISWGLGITKLKSLPLKRTQGIIIVILLSTLAALLFPKPGELYQVMHFPPSLEQKSYFQEDIDGVVMTYQKDDNVIAYINGMSHGGRPGEYFYWIALEAMVFAPQVDDILVIGYGTGSLTEAALKSEEVKHVTVVELSGALIKNLRKIPLFQELLSDPRLELIIGDARRFLSQPGKKYDLILMDPLKTTTSYSNNIYSKEFLELTATRLHPEGVIAIWMDEFPVMLKTVSSVFNHVQVYSTGNEGFCIASRSPLRPIKTDRVRHALQKFSPHQRDMIFQTRKPPVGNEKTIEILSRDAPINRDLKPTNEYYLHRLRYLWKT